MRRGGRWGRSFEESVSIVAILGYIGVGAALGPRDGVVCLWLLLTIQNMGSLFHSLLLGRFDCPP